MATTKANQETTRAMDARRTDPLKSDFYNASDHIRYDYSKVPF